MKGEGTSRENVFHFAVEQKAKTYHKEAARDNAILFPYCLDANGSIRPLEPTMEAGSRLPPASKFNVLFAGKKGKPPLRGNLQMSL